jgi:hypothetical protein
MPYDNAFEAAFRIVQIIRCFSVSQAGMLGGISPQAREKAKGKRQKGSISAVT